VRQALEAGSVIGARQVRIVGKARANERARRRPHLLGPARHIVRAGPVNLGIGAVDGKIPADLAALCRLGMVRIEPGGPAFDDPLPARRRRTVGRADNAAALAVVRRAVPVIDEQVLRLEKVRELVVADEVARLALVALLVALELAAAKLDKLAAAARPLPDLALAVVAGRRTEQLHQ